MLFENRTIKIFQARIPSKIFGLQSCPVNRSIKFIIVNSSNSIFLLQDYLDLVFIFQLFLLSANQNCHCFCLYLTINNKPTKLYRVHRFWDTKCSEVHIVFESQSFIHWEIHKNMFPIVRSWFLFMWFDTWTRPWQENISFAG